MYCSWGYTWHGRYFYHSWLFWLLLMMTITAGVILLLIHRQKVRQRKCPSCNNPVQEVYLRCPDCGQGLKSHCPHCSHIVENSWQFCPHCKKALHSGTPEKPTTADISSA
ncbi:MAG: zinc ribbon domain-containing protein [Deltaproteobacteria bacterium]|nr:zinc ribbon domain-containing protein [Deltaproteobacteria bacterium]MBW2328022.1 zinc ribbon domain-containing protein [Deltaproteobacteria bacterium]